MGTLAFVIRSLFVRSMCTHLNGWHAKYAFFDVVRYTGPLASQVHSPSARYSNSRHTFAERRHLSTAARPPREANKPRTQRLYHKSKTRNEGNASGKCGCRSVYGNFTVMGQASGTHRARWHRDGQKSEWSSRDWQGDASVRNALKN